MFDNFLFDWSYFDEVVLIWDEKISEDVMYNWFWLSNDFICINKISDSNWNSVSSETYSNPLADLWWELNYYFREKIIEIRGTLKANNAEDLNNRIDTLKKVLWQNNKNLDIKVNWTVRRAKASCVNINSLFDRNHYNITWIPFTIQFRIISEFFAETLRQSQTFTSLTAWFIEEVTNRGSVKTEPTVNILINSTTWTDNISFTIWDNSLIITENISTNNTILIDCKEKTVKINWNEIDFSWTFPILEVWANNYEITINGTVNYNITVYYFNNFL